MAFEISNPSPIFLDMEYEIYFRKIRKAENEITQRLGQEKAALSFNVTNKLKESNGKYKVFVRKIE